MFLLALSIALTPTPAPAMSTGPSQEQLAHSDWWRTLPIDGEPVAIQTQADGALAVLDGKHRRILILNTDGAPVAQCPPSGTLSPLRRPVDFVPAEAGGWWVVDAGLDQIVLLDADGVVQRTVSGPGAEAGQLRRPAALAVYQDLLHVADAGNHRIQVFDTDGKLVRALGGYGEGPGEFRDPIGIAVSDDGTLYVADRANHRIQVFGADGSFRSAFGEWGAERGWLSHPRGLSWHGSQLYVTDAGNHRIEVFDGVGRWRHSFGRHAQVPGEHEGKLHAPASVFVSASGGFAAVCEPWEERVQLFRRGSTEPETRSGGATGTVHFGAAIACGGEHTIVADVETHELLVHRNRGDHTELVHRAGTMGSRLGEFRDARALWLDGTGSRGLLVDAASQRLVEFQVEPTPPGLLTKDPDRLQWTRALDLCALRRTLSGPLATHEWIPAALKSGAGEGELLLLETASSTVLRFGEDLQFGGVATRLPRSPVLDFVLWGAGFAFVDGGRREVVVCDAEGNETASLPGGSESFPGWSDPCAIGVLADGGLCVADRGHHRLERLDAQGRWLGSVGGPGIAAGRFRRPVGLCVTDDGHVCVVEEANHRAQWFTPEFEQCGMFGSRLYLMAARRAGR